MSRSTQRPRLLAFLACFTIAPAGFAAPEVRMVYLVPSDRTPRSDYRVAMENAIRHFRLWLRDQMPNGKTITLHDPVVEVHRTSHPAGWYATNPDGDFTLRFWSNCLRDGRDLTGGDFNDPENRWVFYIDADPACGQAVGAAAGIALLPANDLRGLVGEPHVPPCAGDAPDTAGPCRWVGGLGHELGHALLVPHPQGCDVPDPAHPCPSGALLWLGYRTYPSTYLLTEDVAILASSPFLTTQSIAEPLFDCAELIPDRVPPEIVCPDDIVVDCRDEHGRVVDFRVSATDAIDTHPRVICEPRSRSRFPVGVTTVRCTATDESGNTASCSFTVTVRCSGLVPSDCNADGRLNLADGICFLGHLFLARPDRMPCVDEGPSRVESQALFDPNGDREIDVSDAIYLIRFLFSGGPPPVLGTTCVTATRCREACAGAE